MTILVAGCGFRTAPVALRERLALDGARLRQALDRICARLAQEAVILSTCNRMEIYLADPISLNANVPDEIIEFLSEFHGIGAEELKPHLYWHSETEAVRHLFRVACSLDSMIIGEAQIAGQVNRAYEAARTASAVGPRLHGLFQHASRVAGRVRAETQIGQGHVSVSSVAVDYVRQVFERYDDKTVLIIGAGKVSELTLRHLRALRPGRIQVINRGYAKAVELAQACQGEALPWDALDLALVSADIVLSSTGAEQPIVDRRRFRQIDAQRGGNPLIILDLAVPRDFDPAIHDGERTCLFNLDDLQGVQRRNLDRRRTYLPAARAIIDQETRRFTEDRRRRTHGRAIARLADDLQAKRQVIVGQLLSRLNGRLTDEDRKFIEGAFRLLQNQFLHGPITALAEEPAESGGHTLIEALRKLFGMHENP